MYRELYRGFLTSLTSSPHADGVFPRNGPSELITEVAQDFIYAFTNANQNDIQDYSKALRYSYFWVGQLLWAAVYSGSSSVLTDAVRDQSDTSSLIAGARLSRFLELTYQGEFDEFSYDEDNYYI